MLLSRRRPGQCRRFEGEPRLRVSSAGVGPCEPIDYVEEFAQRRQRVRFRHGMMAMHRTIPKRVDHPSLTEHCLPGYPLETRLVYQGGKIVLVGQS